MKTLSVRQPFVDDILDGVKTAEYRTWQTEYRGDLLICSSSTSKDKEIKDYFVLGHALCVVELYQITKKGKMYNWHFKNIRPIQPFKIKGKIKLFDTDDNLIIFLDDIFKGKYNIDYTYEDLSEYYEDLGLVKPILLEV